MRQWRPKGRHCVDAWWCKRTITLIVCLSSDCDRRSDVGAKSAADSFSGGVVVAVFNEDGVRDLLEGKASAIGVSDALFKSCVISGGARLFIEGGKVALDLSNQCAGNVASFSFFEPLADLIGVPQNSTAPFEAGRGGHLVAASHSADGGGGNGLFAGDAGE